MSTRRLTKSETEHLTKECRELLERHERIYGIVRRVARSGMSRVIDFYVLEPVGDISNVLPVRISNLLAAVYNRETDGSSRSWTGDVGGVKIGGCGMDMGWHVVYSVRQALGLGETGPQYVDGKTREGALNHESGYPVSYIQTDYRGRPCHLGYGFRLTYL